ncbi:MAG: tetratricopeptide repeat protein [Pyrinomonadaceae bacterium]
MKDRPLQLIVSLLVIVVCFSFVYALGGYLDEHRVELPDEYRDSDLALQGKRLRGYALGFDGLLADWYWMQSLQYIGGRLEERKAESVNIEDLRPFNLRLLYPLLDNATDLDPHFTTAYSYGAVVLPAIDRDAAIRLTEKGIANNPTEWRFYQYLGYIYWRSKEYDKAADAYRRGAMLPGVPSFMGLMAARMTTEGGSRETAREMYTQMLAEASDDQTKATAEARLRQLDSLDERDAIDGVLRTLSAKSGTCPTHWKQILPLLAESTVAGGREFRIDRHGQVVDPTGEPYIIDGRSCTVRLGPGSGIAVY